MHNAAGLHGYQIALFDILGFESMLDRFGLPEMVRRYESLIQEIGKLEVQRARLFGDMEFQEAPHWTAEGGIFIFSKVHGAYASDSLLLWANRTWLPARGKSPQELEKMSIEPSTGWKARPIPCDNFLNACNEVMCRGLEVGLPLRGALAIGDAVFDEDRRLFLGAPMVEAARLEKEQAFIGAGMCRSFREQIVPMRFSLEFDRHLKAAPGRFWGGAVLDWPRHWRNTRRADAADAVQALNTSPGHTSYYENTIRLIEYSGQFSGQFEGREDSDLREIYPEFSYKNESLAVPARAVRRETIDAKKRAPKA